MKTVKLDDDVYQNLVENKKKGGFKSISALIRYALTMTGEVFKENVTERQERQLLRLKLAEIHATCEKIRELVTPAQVEIVYRDIELKAEGPDLRALMAVDQYRLRKASEEDDRLFGSGEGERK